MRTALLAFLGAAVLAPAAQADGVGAGLPSAVGLTSAGTSAVSSVTNTVVTTSTNAAATVPPAAARATGGTPVAQPVAAVTPAASRVASAATGTVQQTTQAATATVTAVAAPAASAGDAAAGPPASSVTRTVASVVSTVQETTAPVTRTLPPAATPPNETLPNVTAPSAAAPTAAVRTALVRTAAPQAAGSAPAVASAAPPGHVVSTATDEPTIAAPPPAKANTAVATSFDVKAPATALLETVRRGADAVFTPLPSATDSAAAPVVDVARVTATTAREAAESVIATLPIDPFLPRGNPDTPGLGGTPGGGFGPLLLVLAALLAPFVLAAPRSGRRLRPVSDLMRPPAFVSLLERPG